MSTETERELDSVREHNIHLPSSVVWHHCGSREVTDVRMMAELYAPLVLILGIAIFGLVLALM